MYLVCENNPKFDESGRLLRAAVDMGIRVQDKPDMIQVDWNGPEPTAKGQPYFLYGTRSFVLPKVSGPQLFGDKHIFSKQEYLYDYNFLMSLVSHEAFPIFNDDAIILPASFIKNIGTRLFLRPVSGNKQFSGSVFEPSEMERGFHNLVQIDPWELVVVAKPKPVPQAEYRFFCLRGYQPNVEYITGCQYLPEPSRHIPDFVNERAKRIAVALFEEIPFGDSFVMDLAVDASENVSILELNSCNSSSFYCIDPKILLQMLLHYLKAKENWGCQTKTKQ